MTTEERWLFFDTSALIKYVHEEEGSERGGTFRPSRA